jgi:hypothetical protein
MIPDLAAQAPVGGACPPYGPARRRVPPHRQGCNQPERSDEEQCDGEYAREDHEGNAEDVPDPQQSDTGR